MDLGQIRAKALARIKDRRWHHAISLSPELADAASEATDTARIAAQELERYVAQPPEAKASDARGSGNQELSRLRKAAEDADVAKLAAQEAADAETIHLTFSILSPDEYQAQLFKAADGKGEFEMGPFTLHLLELTYQRTGTGPGGKAGEGEDLTLSWDEARNSATHGELGEMQVRAMEENRRIDSFPS